MSTPSDPHASGLTPDWYGLLDSSKDEAHRVTTRVMADLERSPEYRRLHALVSSRSERLGRSLSPELLTAGLELVNALTDRAAIEARAYYNHGVEDGRAARVEEDFVLRHPKAALRVVARALLRIAEAL